MLGLGLGINKSGALSKSVLEKLGILPSDVAFYQSFRRGKSGVTDALTVRRASDNATATILYRSGTEKDRIYNQFSNGDGRYGTIGWSGFACTLSSIPNGVRNTGTGIAAVMTSFFKRGISDFKTSITKRYFIKIKLNVPIEATDVFIKTANGTTTKVVSVLSQVTKGTDSWVSVIITQTDLGTNNSVVISSYVSYPSSEIQNGKAFDVKNLSIVDMGDTSADPLYTKSVAEMETWISQQPSAITVDGSYYLLPYGLQSGELDLEQAMTFCGTSALYVSEVKGQSPVTRDSTQSTASYQPKLLDNGLWYPLSLFDGADDYLSADLPDITAYPFTLGCRINSTDTTGFVFARNGLATTDVQYGIAYNATGDLAELWLNGAVRASIAIPPNRDVYVTFSCDGTNITPRQILDGVQTVGTPVAYSTALTTQANKFIGCISSNAGGTTRTSFFKGEDGEIIIATKALDAAQTQKLWKL